MLDNRVLSLIETRKGTRLEQSLWFGKEVLVILAKYWKCTEAKTEEQCLDWHWSAVEDQSLQFWYDVPNS